MENATNAIIATLRTMIAMATTSMLERRLTMHDRWRQWSGGIDLDQRFPSAVPIGRAMTAPQKCFTQKILGARCALLLLLCADRPKRLFDAAGFGILHQRHPGCFATLRARELLHRNHGALDSSAKKADDDQNMDHDVFSVVECGAAGR
jgi:hypothetical protein